MWDHWRQAFALRNEQLLVDKDQAGQSYYVLFALSAVISALGILAGSETVELGAMLISPLIVPLNALGVGVAEGKARPIGRALLHLSLSVLIAVGIGLIVGSVFPFSKVPELAAGRAQPNLLDLLIALAAGAVGMYGFLRKDISTLLTGVAAAVSLEPPLVVVGLMLSKGWWPVALGASTLFFTNMMAIVAAGAFVLWVLGKRPRQQSEKRVAWTSWAVTGVFVGFLGFFLFQALRQVAREQSVQSQLEARLEETVQPIGGWVESVESMPQESGQHLRVRIVLPDNVPAPDWTKVTDEFVEHSRLPLTVSLTVDRTWQQP